MGRPRKTRADYLMEYWKELEAIRFGMSYRKIAKRYRISLSTVQRLAKMIKNF